MSRSVSTATNLTGEDNADAHLKRQVMGREVVGRFLPTQVVCPRFSYGTIGRSLSYDDHTAVELGRDEFFHRCGASIELGFELGFIQMRI